MGPDKKRTKVQLMDAAEKAIEDILAKQENSEVMSLTEIEELVLELRQEFGKGATQALVEEAEEERGPGPICPTCGQEMRNKGRKRRRVVTRSGEVEMERMYYYCEKCRAGFFPPG
jgi:DNA repair exonuclease SbcCD ATPase subunit